MPAALLEHLRAMFPMAEHAPECLDVHDALTQRLKQLEAREMIDTVRILL
jgi:hypothetical protein